MINQFGRSILENSLLKEFSENQKKLDAPPKIKRLKFFKNLDDSDLPNGYKLIKGEAHADKWQGEISKPYLTEIKLPVYKIESTSDTFELIYDEGDRKWGGLIKVQWEPEDQGHFFKLQKHLYNCGIYLFKYNGFKSFKARADRLIDDIGVRGETDWRWKKTNWRRHRSSGKMIKLSRLNKMWLHMKYMVPFQMLDPNAMENEIAWLSPYELEILPKDELEALDERLGNSPRRWKFTDLAK